MGFQCGNFRLQFGNSRLHLLDHGTELALRKSLVNVLLAIDVPRLNIEENRSLNLARIFGIAKPLFQR